MQISRKVASVLVLLVGTFAACADISLGPAPKHSKGLDLPEAPPEPVPVTIQVKRGSTVEIPLRVFGITTQTMTYRLRSTPEFGELSELKMTGRGTGMLTYRHSGEKTQQSDHFLFATQTANGVSASAKITIVIVDDPPALSVPEGLEWGTVMIGTTATRRFLIENRGGGLLKGTVTVDEPWKIDGKAAYSLRSGESQTFALRFTPDSEQTFEGVVRFSSDPHQTTALTAVAEAAIRIEPRKLVLTPSGDTTRSGTVKILNRTNEEQPLRFRAGPKLTLSERMSVPPNGEISVPITTSPGLLDPVIDEIQVDSPGFATTIAVQAPAVGPIVRADPASLSFGKIDNGSSVTATVNVTNSGGTGVAVELVAPPQLEIDAADSAFWLGAGATKAVKVLLVSRDAGKFEASLHLKTASAVFEIPVEAELIPKPFAPAPPARSTIANAVRPDLTPIVRGPAIENLRVKRVGSATCEITWETTEEVPPSYQLERLASEGVGVGWTPISNVVISTAVSAQTFSKNLAMHGVTLADSPGAETADAAPAGGKRTASALIKDLKAETAYSVRLIAIDAKDETHRSITYLEFQTPRAWTKTISFRFGLPSFLLLSVVLVCRRTRRGAGSGKPTTKPFETFVPPTVPPPANPVAPVARIDSMPSIAAPVPPIIPAWKKLPLKVPKIRETSPGCFQLYRDED